MLYEMKVLVLLTLLVVTDAKDQYLCPNNPQCFCKKDNTTMNCSGKKLTSIPDKIPTQVERLWLDHNEIINIDGGHLCSLPNLWELHLENNQLSAVRSFAFDGSCLPSLRDLYLRNNRITILEENAFVNMTSLNRTFLENNYIGDIHPQAFSGKSALTFLHLGGNYLKSVPSVGNLVNLQSLYLDTNKVTNATFPAVFNRLRSLSSLGLSNNNIQVLENHTFRALNFSNLRKLELSRNKIIEISVGAFSPLGKLQSLKIGRNPLSGVALAAGLAGLKNAPLVSLNIASLQLEGKLPDKTFQLLQGSPLLTLIMSNNKIDRIPGMGFSYLQKLKTLDLSNSGIYVIANNSFTGMSALYNLLLYGNYLDSVPENLPPSLQYLYLYKNQIGKLPDGVFSTLKKLRRLYLEVNKVELSEHSFDGLSNLQILHLTRNNIHQLPGEVFMPLVNLHSLMLNENPLTIIQGDKTSVFEGLTSLTYLSLSDNQCTKVPSNLFNRLQSLMTLRLDNNQLGPLIGNDDTGMLFSGLRKLKELSLVNNKISRIPDASFKDLYSLETLNLTNNVITGWGPHLFSQASSLKSLDLSHNYISLVNKTSVQDFRSMEALNMSGNPFACTCDLRWFRDWLNTTSINIARVSTYKCNSPMAWKGKDLLSFDRTKIECLWFTLPVLLSCVGGGIVFITLVIIVIYRKRWTLRLRMYRARKRCCGRSDRGDYRLLPGADVVYDAYISCSNEDENWVLHNLLPDIDTDKLGDKPFNGKFRLYFDPRDKDLGMNIAENIEKHMRMSRKVIVVLTDDYLSKERYTSFELQLAFEMKREGVIDDVIVVKVGHVAANRIPRILHFMMENRKFLEWEDVENARKAFKERLQDILAEVNGDAAEVV